MVSTSEALAILHAVQVAPFRGAALRKFAMERLAELPNYNWCGIYRLEGEELILDEFVGEATDHTRIKVGVGVCGTAVAKNANQVVDDVSQVGNYLACSIKTKSEIVVLIREGQTILGQIDIDGHTPRAFDGTDEALLNEIAVVLADRWTEKATPEPMSATS
ncbi:MAG: GAF domain-containing protein [Armatimonadetes bacterium]|nr:GAF domain-containing protein [Armatimonadota bacterium]